MKQFLSIVLLSVSLYMIHKLVYSEHGHTHDITSDSLFPLTN